MSRPLLALLALLAAPLAAAADVEPLSLTAALRLAAERHPLLVEQAAAVAAAEGELLAARTLPHNPVLEVERASRDEAGERSKDREIALEQELELGGQRRQRIASATARLEAAHARRARAGQELAAEVATAFVDALAARELTALAHLEQELAGALLVFADRRLEAGAGTLVERNVARAAAGRAEWAHALAAAEEAAARIELAALIGVPAAELPPLAGALPAGWPPPP
ncbi:MAG TPA: TolC family protein, partial [Thermoanaerobaculia bacterium]|nr:TolC family protein [Thermoanaerobaculia bacterium]